MKLDRVNVIVYEANDNIYINISSKCTAECIFCTKRYFAARYLENINKNIKNDILQSSNQSSKENMLKSLDSHDLSRYNEAAFMGSGEPLAYLDEYIYGHLRSGTEPIYGINLHLPKEPSLEEIKKELCDYDFSEYNEAVFTGMGEPLMRLDMVLGITKWLTSKGMRVRLDTIGHAKLIHPERDVAKELARSGMKRVSISLNAHNEEVYNKLCRPKLENSYSSMLEFANDIVVAGMELRFTIMNLPIVDIEKCRQIARKYRADFMVRTFF
jgi:cyclic pyranopterin phosphate synthase